MKNKYFNEFEFKNAMEYVEKNPLIAKTKFEDYIKKYPNDYSAYPYYITCLIILGKFEEAKKYLNYLENVNYENSDSKYPSEKIQLLKKKIIFNHLKLLSYQHKYDELYKICLDNYSVIASLKLTSLVVFCRKKLNMIDKKAREGSSYLYSQIIDYKEEDFWNHIKKHLADFNKDLEFPNAFVFSTDFPIVKVIETIKSSIPSTERLLTGFYEDTYVFKYDFCGRVNNKITNYFKVICFNDTSDIITLYPCLDCEELPCIDLNYLNPIINNESTKVKRISQIDKFNRRYKIN